MLQAPVRPKRLLLFGEQRTGTSLLQAVLHAHPAIEVLPPDFDLNLAVNLLGLRPGQTMTARQAHVLWQRMKRALKKQLPDEPPSQLTSFDGLLAYRMGLATADAQVTCMKFHGPFSPVRDLLAGPDFHCLHIVRDVRDVLLSRAYRGEQQLDEWALQWRESSARMRALAGHPKLLSVRFEDLVSAPAREFARIFAWLGVADGELPSPRLDSEGQPLLQNSSFGELQAFDRRAIARYREHRGSPLVRYAQWLCRSELQQWRYPIEAGLAPSLALRAHFARRRATLAAIRAPRRAKNAITAALLPSLAD